jgi:hypothetical protein
LAEGLELAVSDPVRETVEVVERLKPDHPDGVPIAVIKTKLDIDRSAAYRRARQACDRGFLKNL